MVGDFNVYVDVLSSLASIGSLASPDATPVSSPCVRRALTGCPRGCAPSPEGSGARPCRLSSALGDASRVVRPSALLGSSYRVIQRPPLRRCPAWCPLPHTASDVLRHDDATRHTRSALVVSHHLDGLLHLTVSGLVASRYRPWGSPRFRIRRVRARCFPVGASTLRSSPLPSSRACRLRQAFTPSPSPVADRPDLEVLLHS